MPIVPRCLPRQGNRAATPSDGADFARSSRRSTRGATAQPQLNHRTAERRKGDVGGLFAQSIRTFAATSSPLGMLIVVLMPLRGEPCGPVGDLFQVVPVHTPYRNDWRAAKPRCPLVAQSARKFGYVGVEVLRVTVRHDAARCCTVLQTTCNGLCELSCLSGKDANYEPGGRGFESCRARQIIIATSSAYCDCGRRFPFQHHQCGSFAGPPSHTRFAVSNRLPNSAAE